MRNLCAILIFLAVMASCGGARQQENKSENVEIAQVENQLGFAPDSLECVEGKVKNGQFFSTLMNALGMGAQSAYDLTHGFFHI